MPLQFIDNATLGLKERRLIRSHVMKGKNAGRPRPSRRRPPNAIPASRIMVHSGCPACAKRDISCLVHGPNHALGLQQLFWHDLALISFPQQLSHGSRKLVHQWFLLTSEALYPPAFCAKFDIMSSVWAQYVFLDEAYFYCILAISASFADFFLGKPQNSLEATKYLSKVYMLTNQRLSAGTAAVSDESIAVVIALAVFQRLHHQQSTGLIHFDGLHQMIQLRGGIGKLAAENRAMAQKQWRLDIEFALQDGLPPRFCGDEVPGSILLKDSKVPKASVPAFREIDRFRSSVCPEMNGIFHDITIFTDILNSRVKENKLSPMDFSETVFSLLYRLLHFKDFWHSSPAETSAVLLHLTLLAFMTGLLLEYGRNHSKYDLLSKRLRRALQAILPSAEKQERNISLWCLYAGGVSILDGNDNQWLLPLLSRICQDLNLNSWQQVRRVLCEFPWVHSLHDDRGQRLWTLSREMG